MFGIGLYNAYGQFSIAGINGALLVALFTRLLVGIGWYRLFDKAGITWLSLPIGVALTIAFLFFMKKRTQKA